ncbi:hypothetical protein [Bacteroides neonati]|uniref:hypothetical protein n=1 Tax=Bacteroides neonati TaxID=1347393 RepID=UPI0004B0D465|nr:hypothetical protein [Bacteroides neonati]
MEQVLEGLLLINGQDVYTTYGAYLTELKAGDHANYNELLKPPAMKPYTAVAYREQDGEALPDVLPIPRFEARDITLHFAITAETKTDWFAKYTAFITLLKSGWLNIEVPELNKTYKMYYKDCTNYEQLTYLKEEAVYASRFKLKLREPKPGI